MEGLRYALVTGAGRGIGRAVALRLAKDGYRILVNFVSNVEAANQTLDEIRGLGSDGELMQFDVADASATEAALKAWHEAHPGEYISVLVNNAGVSESTPFMDYTQEAFDKVMDLNVKGVFNTTRAAVECMVPRGSGVVLPGCPDGLRNDPLGDKGPGPVVDGNEVGGGVAGLQPGHHRLRAAGAAGRCNRQHASAFRGRRRFGTRRKVRREGRGRRDGCLARYVLPVAAAVSAAARAGGFRRASPQSEEHIPRCGSGYRGVRPLQGDGSRSRRARIPPRLSRDRDSRGDAGIPPSRRRKPASGVRRQSRPHV